MIESKLIPKNVWDILGISIVLIEEDLSWIVLFKSDNSYLEGRLNKSDYSFEVFF